MTVYEVSDLVRGVRSHVPAVPRLDVAPSGGLYPLDGDLDAREPARVIDEDALLELIRSTVDPGSWDEPGNSITIRDGKLIVRRAR